MTLKTQIYQYEYSTSQHYEEEKLSAYWQSCRYAFMSAACGGKKENGTGRGDSAVSRVSEAPAESGKDLQRFYSDSGGFLCRLVRAMQNDCAPCGGDGGRNMPVKSILSALMWTVSRRLPRNTGSRPCLRFCFLLLAARRPGA